MMSEFLSAAQRDNVQLLHEDITFIKKCLTRIPRERHRDVLRAYLSKWYECISNHENVVSTQNEGRRIANAYIREKQITI